MIFKFKKLQCLFLLVILITPDKLSARSAVTYEFSGGRFGDNLLAYCHAKWVCYKYNLPLLFKPFKYSDQLKLHELEDLKFDEHVQFYKKRILINCYSDPIEIEPDDNILYIIDYFAESPFEIVNNNNPFPVDWNDMGFKNELKNLINPTASIEKIAIPQDVISVAAHVRKGTGVDVPNHYWLAPHKTPPDSYFIEQIRKVADIFANDQIYVFLFTDHDKPLELLEKYKNELDNTRIKLVCRETENLHNLNVLEDFFSLTEFDCLIRPDSNFSIMASKLANYQVEICPKHIVKVTPIDPIIVDEVTIIKNLTKKRVNEDAIEI